MVGIFWLESCGAGYFQSSRVPCLVGVKPSDTKSHATRRRVPKKQPRGPTLSWLASGPLDPEEVASHQDTPHSMPPSRLFLLLAHSFLFLPSSESFLTFSAQNIQFCSSRFKTHTMPLSPSSIVDFVENNSQDGANIDTGAFPSDPNSSNAGTGQGILETDDLIRVAVLGTGMMGQVRFRVCSACWWRWPVCFPIQFIYFSQASCLLPCIAIHLMSLFRPFFTRSGTLLLHIWLFQSSN